MILLVVDKASCDTFLNTNLLETTVITHHNWMWVNLILESNNLRVADTRTIEKEIS